MVTIFSNPIKIEQVLFHSFHFLWGWECAPLPHCHLKPSKIENHFPACHKATSTAHGIILTHFCVDLLEGRIILIYLEVDFGRGDGERVSLATTTGAMSWAGVLRTTGPERRHQRSQAVPLAPCLLSRRAPQVFKHALEKKCLYYAVSSFHVR